jgi:hypothetical protein
MPWKLLLGLRDEGTPLGLAPQAVLSVKSPIHCMELAYGQNFLNATPSNKPLEWTGLHKLSTAHPTIPACHSEAAFGGLGGLLLRS